MTEYPMLNEQLQSFRLWLLNLNETERLLASIAILISLLLLITFIAWLRARRRAARVNVGASANLSGLFAAQNEVGGRLTEMRDSIAGEVSRLAFVMEERLDENRKSTNENVIALRERLVSIDASQKRISELSQNVSSLKTILAGNQTRGAFGQVAMETIVADGLPASSYQFQPTLSNRTRPDCAVRMPGQSVVLIIDSKFPMEPSHRLRSAKSEAQARAAAQEFQTHIRKHVRDVAEKYQIPGETFDTSLIFIPSEGLLLLIHEEYGDLVQFAHQNRVQFVGPALLQVAIQMIQAIHRDEAIRDQSTMIQAEVRTLLEEVGRLDTRVDNLKRHFRSAGQDLDQIDITANKITRRCRRFDLLEDAPDAANADGANNTDADISSHTNGRAQIAT